MAKKKDSSSFPTTQIFTNQRLKQRIQKIFRKIDKLVILDIYAASEKNKDKIDINKMFKENLKKMLFILKDLII